MTIKKTKTGYKLVSKKTGKNLGNCQTKESCRKREQEVQYFKRKKGIL